jgi:4-hydroxy-tetrahydrodipicolinate synthase
MFTGSLVAIVTPFKNGRVDERALGDLIEFQIANGTDGIVPCGTSGESATLTYEEHDRVIEFAVEATKRRVPVIAGTGSNSTDEAITLTKHAKQAGADGALLICPYYNKPTQEGLYRHYKTIADAVDLPLVIYNIPSRTSVNILPATIARLSSIRNIVAIKEGAGSLGQVSEIIQACGDRITVLAGDDPLTLPMMAVGAKGVITVTANIAPADMAALVDAFAAGKLDQAKALHYKLYPLFTALFYETNPIPVKEALGMMGKIQPELRLPLCPMSAENREKLAGALKDYGLL